MASVRRDSEQGVVLGPVAFGEDSRVVRVLTLGLGVVAVWVPGGGGRKGRNVGLWQPLNLLEFNDLNRRGAEGLFRFKEVRRPHLHVRIPSEVPRSAVAFFLAELVAKTLPEDTPHPEIAQALWQTALALDSEPHIAWLHVVFLAQMVQLLGLAPSEPPSPRHGLSWRTGEWVWEPLRDEDHLEPALAHPWAALCARGDLSALAGCQAKDRKALLVGPLRYLRHQMGAPTALKSLAVLEEVFS